MKTKSLYFAVAILVALGGVSIAFAQRPETDIDPNRHSHLADAQKHVIQAYDKILEAQRDNKDELGGHAERAIQLLDECNHELKRAAEYADHHPH